MSILFWGLTISLIGKVLLAVGVLKAHTEIAHEHRIDKKVLRTFKIERLLTIIGLALIVSGYLLEIYFYGYTPITECVFDRCVETMLMVP